MNCARPEWQDHQDCHGCRYAGDNAHPSCQIKCLVPGDKPKHFYMSKHPNCRYHHLWPVYLHQEPVKNEWWYVPVTGPRYKPDKRVRREVAAPGAPIKRIRLRQRTKRDEDANVFIYYPINPTYNPKCRREDFDKLTANELAMASMKLHFGCYEGTWCEEQNAFPSEILANASLARICYPRPLKTYILGKGRYKPWCTDPHGNQFEPKNVASWGCMVLPFCKLDQPGEFDEKKYLRPVAENGDLLNCMDICPRNENGRGLTDKPNCRPIPSNPENDYFGVLSITEKMDWCDAEKSTHKDPWSLNPPCNPIPQCRGNVEGRAPDARDWRKNLLYYQKNVDGVPCVVYKQCSALTEEERVKYHCVGSAMTTSTTKASTTTTAKTTAKTTTEKPNDGLGDEVILIAALCGALFVFIIVTVIVLCCCLKKKDKGPKGKKPIVDDMMNVGAGNISVDMDPSNDPTMTRHHSLAVMTATILAN
ncbi:unnamed protein product, partial [Mesorhabditis spiculigera]